MEYSTLPQPVTGKEQPVTGKPSYHDEQPGLEVVHDPAGSAGLEVAPEPGLHVYRPERDAKESVSTGVYPPGIYPQDAYPEVYYGDHPHGAGPALPAGSPTEKARWSRRKWLIVGGVALLVIIAAIVGGVVGGRAAANNKSAQVASDEATSATATASPSVVASSTSSSALPTATSIAKNSALSAVSFRTALDGSPAGDPIGFVIAILFRDPTGSLFYSYLLDFAVEGDDGNTWTAPISLNPPTPIQNETGLYMGGHCTANATKNSRTGKDEIKYQLHLVTYYVNETNKVNGFEYDFTKATEDPPALQINDRGFNALTGSRVATYWPWVAFQDRSGFIQISNALRDPPYKATQLLEHTGTARTHLNVVPVSTDHEKITDSSYGIFYQAQDDVLTPALPGTNGVTGGSGAVTKSWPPISKFPKIVLPKQGSFAAFSYARSAKQSDGDLVNTFVLYQDETSQIKQVWTDDSETWQTSSPAALTKADKGTDITCLTPASSNNTYAAALYVKPQTKLTRCYFQREGFVIEVQQKGTDWAELGKLPIS